MFLFLLTQCQQKHANSKSITAPLPKATLINSWRVYRLPANSFEFISNHHHPSGTRPFEMTFTKHNGILFNLSVNNCANNYSINNNLLCFGENIVCTEKCCDSGSDEYLMKQCSGCLEYAIHIDTLTIYTEMDSLQFIRIAK